MNQILSSLPFEQSGQILCCYANATSQIHIIRIANISNCYFERVVFPGERLLFEALQDAQMEIHTAMMASAILSDKIPCNRLRVNEGLSYSLNTIGVTSEYERLEALNYPLFPHHEH